MPSGGRCWWGGLKGSTREGYSRSLLVGWGGGGHYKEGVSQRPPGGEGVMWQPQEASQSEAALLGGSSPNPSGGGEVGESGG